MEPTVNNNEVTEVTVAPGMDKSDLVSRCKAIQYGVFIAGIVLLIVVGFNWYQDYTNACLKNCRTTYKTCRKSCAPTPLLSLPIPSIVPDMVTAVMEPVIDASTSSFSNRNQKRETPVGKISEHNLENFLNYRSDQQYNDFKGGYVAPEETEMSDTQYDPARDSLEQSVFDSHSEFIEDAYVSTQGPNSTNSVRDDTNDINPRVGLRRIDYTSAYSQNDARTVSSEYPDQVMQANAGTFVL